MKIRVLGTRGEVEESAPYHSKKSGVLIDNKLLLDCGNSTFLDYKPDYVLITHLHPDHAYFVRRGYIKSGGSLPDDQAIKWYAPETFDNMKINIPSKAFTIDGYCITPIPTIHSLKVQSQAYLIKKGREAILYTGDMIWIEKKLQPLFQGTSCSASLESKKKPLDLVITEASFMRKGGMVRRNCETGKIYGHTGVLNLITFFKPYTSRILFVHFGAWFYKDIEKARHEFAELAKTHDIEIIVGYDGLQITV